MTTPDTDTLAGLLADATPGPWTTEDTNSARLSMVAKSIHPGSNGNTVCMGQIAGPDKEANARLIALTPELAAETIALRAENAALRARIERLEAALRAQDEASQNAAALSTATPDGSAIPKLLMDQAEQMFTRAERLRRAALEDGE